MYYYGIEPIITKILINGESYLSVFLNEKKEAVSYYIDVIDDIDIEYGKGLYYDDLYLDITIDKINGDVVKVWDEDELQQALEENDITKEQYEKAYHILKDLLCEIASNSNIYVNNDHKTYIEKNFII